MKKTPISKKLFVLVVAINLILISLCSVALAAAPAITIQSPANNQFFFSGSSCTTVCNITNSPTGSVYVFYPESNSIASASLSLTSGTTYQGSFTITNVLNGYSALINSSGQYIGFKQFEVAASNSSGSKSVYRNYAVTYYSQSYYSQEAYVNSSAFIYPRTSKYNCFAYAVGAYNAKYGPASTKSVLDDFFEKSGSYLNRAGYAYAGECAENQYPDAVYFSGYHAARVIGWSSDGKPYIMESKWGDLEALFTNGRSPFTGDYGTPLYWWSRY